MRYNWYKFGCDRSIKGARPRRTTWTKALRLTCWNVDGVRGRKQELDHFLGQYRIDIYLFTDTHLRPGVVFRMANSVCHRNDRLTDGGGTAIPVSRGINHHVVPVQGLGQQEATAIQVMMAKETGENHGGLPVPHPNPNCFGPVCLASQRSSRLHGR